MTQTESFSVETFDALRVGLAGYLRVRRDRDLLAAELAYRRAVLREMARFLQSKGINVAAPE